MVLKSSFVFIFSVLIATFIAACGSSSATAGSSYGSSTYSPVPTTGGNSSTVIQTATVTVKGQPETVLTDIQGITLYYYASDSATQSTCSNSCTHIWHPLLFTNSGQPTSAIPLAGKLSVQMNANGSQVVYNGHPLYTFSGDTGPGQTNGEGLFGGMWLVVTPNLAVSR